MKEKLYTIPLNEAFNQDSECAFCSLFKELECKALYYTMGYSYMEPDVRIKTNELGFCKKHFNKMYRMKNRLGLSLMVSSHFDEIMSRYDSYYKNKYFSVKRSLSKKKKICSDELLNNIENSCLICDKISVDMDKFYDTFIFMWKKDNEFKKKVLNSNGFCLTHFDKIVNLAHKKMSESEFGKFFNIVFTKQKAELLRTRSDLEWFIQKFDYRFKDEPWKNSKNALKRSIIKIASENPEENKEF